jgi:hypothetical protein
MVNIKKHPNKTLRVLNASFQHNKAQLKQTSIKNNFLRKLIKKNIILIYKKNILNLNYINGTKPLPNLLINLK